MGSDGGISLTSDLTRVKTGSERGSGREEGLQACGGGLDGRKCCTLERYLTGEESCMGRRSKLGSTA